MPSSSSSKNSNSTTDSPNSSSSTKAPFSPASSRTKRLAKHNPRRSTSYHGCESTPKTKIRINVYDLLPPGKLATVLWTIGSSLLHTGVAIKNREYAYGGHEKRGVSGVYYTRPRLEPPGGTFRLEIFHGYTFLTPSEIETVIKEASERFQGTSYSLLKNNCNHFTSYLCLKLTRREAPRWINRAAGIGVAFPCVVPRDWIQPPDYETADGELVDDEEDDDERTRILRKEQWRRPRVSEEEQSSWESQMDRIGGKVARSGCPSDRPRPVMLRDASGREMPPSERAPVPRGLS
ncbi:DUF862-domain-containing protein [Tothia fuscella]|uniref:DUF862-domain-containing protein n=1 Tax=Tothia fuscella TaxID=1048955 RepID=A0A9P4NR54_9PEZI|nr:DUF862-domain-containing protein [Tothia fuscella]